MGLQRKGNDGLNWTVSLFSTHIDEFHKIFYLILHLYLRAGWEPARNTHTYVLFLRHSCLQVKCSIVILFKKC